MSIATSMTRRQFAQTAAACLGAAGALEAAKKSPWQIGCYTRPWAEWEYRVAFDAIAAAGYKYVGLMTHKAKPATIVTTAMTTEQAAAIGAEAKQRGMGILSIYSGEFPFQKSVEAGIEGLKKIIDNAAACGCPNLLLGGTTKPELVGPYYKVVAECCPYAASKKIGISVKPHGGQNATGDQCRKLVATVGQKNFGVWYDPGNIFYYSDGKSNPIDDIASVKGLIVGMAIKDFKPPKEVMVTPGTGLVNFKEVLKRAKKGGFKGGPLVIECLDKVDQAKLTEEARKARLMLEKLTA